MPTILSPDRMHELNVFLYLKELEYLVKQATNPQITDAGAWVADYYNRYLSLYQHPGVSAPTVRRILLYRDVERWEWVSFFTQNGYTPKQIGEILGVTARTISNTLARTYGQNLKTLQRWLNLNETIHDLHSLQQATEVSELVVPSRNVAGVLREPL